MRFLFITQHYSPEPNFITTGLAEHLARQNHEVCVVTAHPNYPLGRFYPSVRFWFPKFTQENGVRIWRVPIFPNHSKSKILRALCYLSFVLSAALCLLMTQPLKPPQRVIVYQTPFFLGILALPFRLFSCNIIYLCADLWPESLIAAGVAPQRTSLAMLYWFSRWINKWANTIITSTQGMKHRFLKDGISTQNIHCVPVWVDGIPQVLPSISPKTKLPRKIVYAGNLGPAQNLGVLIEAAKLLQDQAGHVTFELYGTGTEIEKLQGQAAAGNLQNVAFHGRCTPEEAFAAVNSATAAFVHLTASPLFHMTLPSKLASCLAAGTVLLCGVDGEVNRLFSPHPEVLLFPSDDVKSLTELIRLLLRMTDDEIVQRASKSRQLYLETFEKKSLLQRYGEICMS